MVSRRTASLLFIPLLVLTSIGIASIWQSAIGRSAPSTLVYAYGDSLTEQDHTTALGVLLPHVEVINRGISGQSSGLIAMRQGGIVMTVSATQIPRSGTVTIEPSASVTPWNSGQVAGAFMRGSLAGVAGEISRTDDGSWVFSRSEPGAAVPLEAGTAFSSATSQPKDGGVLISWMGRNDVAFDWPTQREGVVAATKAMVEAQDDRRRRFLVLSAPTATSEVFGSDGHGVVAEINAGLADAFPGNYIDIRRHIIDNGLTIAGITPSAADKAAIAADTLPPSLMTDDIHPNAICRELVTAPFIAAELRKRGWV